MQEKVYRDGPTFKMEVAGVERDLLVCPLNDDISIAAFVILGDVEMTEACARELNKKVPEHDIMITAESKGVPLVHEMARQKGESRYVVARKSPKLYMQNSFSVEVQSITTAKKQKLFIDEIEANRMKDKKVLIVDDVISTGESIRAVEKLVKISGGTVVGRACILAEGDAIYRDDIIYLEELPLIHNQ